MITLKYNGTTYAEFTAAQLQTAGVPEAEIQAAISKDRAVAVSSECRRRIYAAASAEAQMNMATAVGVISSKTASTRTDAEKEILAGAEATMSWIAEMRQTYSSLAADADADFTSDAAWPELPAQIQGMMQDF